jgi:hypothetical protein
MLLRLDKIAFPTPFDEEGQRTLVSFSSWKSLRGDLPRRTVAGHGLYEERFEGRADCRRRIFFSAEGHVRSESETGELLWMRRADGTTFWDFTSGEPWRYTEENGGRLDEREKNGLYLLRPRDWDSDGADLDYDGWSVALGSESNGERLIHAPGRQQIQRITLTVDLRLGLIRTIVADLDPTQGEWIRHWTPSETLHPALFDRTGPYRDSGN